MVAVQQLDVFCIFLVLVGTVVSGVSNYNAGVRGKVQARIRDLASFIPLVVAQAAMLILAVRLFGPPDVNWIGMGVAAVVTLCILDVPLRMYKVGYRKYVQQQ